LKLGIFEEELGFGDGSGFWRRTKVLDERVVEIDDKVSNFKDGGEVCVDEESVNGEVIEDESLRVKMKRNLLRVK
jgi:hypothetical protein